MNAADTTDTTNTLKPITAMERRLRGGKQTGKKNRDRERKFMVDMDRITREIPPINPTR